MIKLNRWLKRYSNRMTFLSIPFILLGLLFKVPILFLIATMLCGFPIVVRAYQSLRLKVVGIELLVTIAVLGALSIHEYSECAIVTFLFQFGNYLELNTLKKTRNAIKELIEYAPSIAYKKEGNEIEEIDVEDIEIDDLLLVKEGGKVGVDGIIVAYEGYFNESSINGESKLAHKTVGDLIYAGTILESGTVEMKATRVGEDTTYAKIIALVEEAQDSKSPIERFIDSFARYYTPFVIVMAAVTYLLTHNIDTSITVLVLACPGALVIGAPVANVAGIGKGAREGILYKGGDTIHTFVKSDYFLFDKTGTLTKGRPSVVSYYTYTQDPQYLIIAASIENKGTHPLGKAIIDYSNAPLDSNIEVEVIKGIGMKGIFNQEEYYIGNEKILDLLDIQLLPNQLQDIQRIKDQGESLVLFAGKELYLCFGIADTIREGAKEAISKLSKHGKIVMLTGDHDKIAKQVGNEIGIDTIYSNLLPEEKYNILTKLQSNHSICFIGDGINDSPSIMKADTGIAMGNGTDIAIECSDLVILNSDLCKLPQAYSIAKKTVAITYENIAIALGTVILLLLGLIFGYIHMASGMLIHEGSILVVIFNAMRILIKKRGK